MTYWQKEHLYPLVIILGNLINYREGMINIEIELIIIRIERKEIMTSFNILLLGNNKAVLGML